MLRSKVKNIQVFEDYLKVALENTQEKVQKVGQCVKLKLNTQHFCLPQVFLVVNIDEENQEFTVIIPKKNSWFLKVRKPQVSEVNVQKILGEGLEKKFFLGKKILIICEAERAFELEELVKSFDSQTTQFLKITPESWSNSLEEVLNRSEERGVVLINTGLKMLKKLEKTLQSESKVVFLTSFLGFSCGSQACYGCVLKVDNQTKYLRACENPLLFLEEQPVSFRLKNE